MSSPRRVVVVEAGQPDADSLASMFLLLGYGGLSVSSFLHHHGYAVEYFPMFASTRLDWGAIDRADYLLISTMVHTARLAYAIADGVRQRTGDGGPVIVFGGPHPTCEPEDALAHCDFVVVNEGEETALELLRHLDAGTGGEPRAIEGLVFRDGEGGFVYTPRRPPMTDIDFPIEPGLVRSYPGVIGNLLRTGRLRMPLPVAQFSRGCPYSCSFCLGSRQLGRQYRTRSVEVVIGDLERLHRLTRAPTGMFHDNDLAIDREATKSLLRAMIRRGTKINHLSAFTRIDSTRDEELWHLFDEAGIANVFLGVESLSQRSLDGFHKGTTVDGIHEAMARLERYQVKAKVMASFVVGDGPDPLGELELIRRFWRSYHRRLLRVVIQPLIDYPFQHRYRGEDQLIADEKFIHYDWDYFGGDFLVFYPDACPPSVLQRAFLDTFAAIHCTPPSIGVDLDYRLTQAYIRYTHRRKDRWLRLYGEALQRLEQGKYDCAGGLIAERLADDAKPLRVDIGEPLRRQIPIGPSGSKGARLDRWRVAGSRLTTALRTIRRTV